MNDMVTNKSTVLGFDNLEPGDIQYPYLKLIQRTSVGILDKYPDYKVGNFYHTLTEEQFDGKKGLVVSLIYRRKQFVLMVPMSQGGGIVGMFDTMDMTKVPFIKGRGFVKNDLDVVPSYHHYLKIWEPIETEAVLITSRISNKKSQLWMTLARHQGVDIFKCLYRLTSEDRRDGQFVNKTISIGFHDPKFCSTEQEEKAKELFHMVLQHRRGTPMVADDSAFETEHEQEIVEI